MLKVQSTKKFEKLSELARKPSKNKVFLKFPVDVFSN
jgi:hypothetical protein